MPMLDVRHLITPAYAAALGLVAIQTGIGILFKAAQTGGKYSFSYPSSITISETLKLCLSTSLFYRELKRRNRDLRSVKTPPLPEKVESGEANGTLRRVSESTESDETLLSDSMESQVVKSQGHKLHCSTWTDFYHCCLAEMPVETRYGFAHLALLYALINNSIFVLFRLADPGTIQLIKSGGTLITALVMYMCVGTKLVKGQWLAVFLQVAGLVVTQYHPEMGSSYPLSTYSILWFQTFLSAVSGVYNQALCQSGRASQRSLHVDNMALYAAGAATNVSCYVIIRFIKAGEPGFFTGYNSIGALMVIASNVFIGLAMTAVYKYADAVIKCFATAISTGILLYVAPLLFKADFSALVVPGTVVVFISTYLYMDSAPPKNSNGAEPSKGGSNAEDPVDSGRQSFLRTFMPYGRNRKIGYGICFAISAIIIAGLAHWESKPAPDSIHNSKMSPLLSPFRNSLAIVRFEDEYEQSVAPMMQEGYSPYFHTMHLSQPDWTPGALTETNITHDFFGAAAAPYAAVSEVVRILLKDTSPALDGILFFKDTSWLRPLAFKSDTERMWLLDSPDSRCFSGISALGGMSEDDEANVAPRLAVEAANVAHEMDSNYAINPNAWCSGWSDMFYLPRRFFKDFVFLADIFAIAPVPAQTAIPTIFHIIDGTYRQHSASSLIDPVGDCWNPSYSNNGPTVEDILWRRCGQGFDYENESAVVALYERLQEDAGAMQ